MTSLQVVVIVYAVVVLIFTLYSLRQQDFVLPLYSFTNPQSKAPSSDASSKPSLFDQCPPYNYTFDDPEILKMLDPYKPKPPCKTKEPLTLLENGRLRINEKHPYHLEVKCKGRCATFEHNYKNRYTDWIPFEEDLTFECDIIPVMCEKINATELDGQYAFIHTQIYPHARDRKKLYGSLYTETSSPKVCDGRFHPHVHILLLDAMGMFPLKRQMPRLASLLLDELQAVPMNLMAKVAENSKPNSFAMFFGEIPIEVDSTIYGGGKVAPTLHEHDSCDRELDNETFYQFEYEDAGYKTLWACDYLSLLTFAYASCKGFRHQMSTHYMRPFQEIFNSWGDLGVKMESNDLKRFQFEESCTPVHRHGLRYWEEFVQSYPDTPKTSILWNTDAHDEETNMAGLDLDFVEAIRRNQPQLDDSFLFVMGDHGQRYGSISYTEQGSFEGNNPAMFIVLPKRLRNTSMHEVMREKENVLTSHHDFHATLIDIVRHQPISSFEDTNYLKINGTYGSSWLREYDAKTPRSCRALFIPSQHCTCNFGQQRIWGGDLFGELTIAIEDDFNGYLKKANLTDLCEEILVGEIGIVLSLNTAGFDNYYKVEFDTKRWAKFSVNYARRNGTLFQSPENWNRVNRYGLQSDCLPNELAKYRHLCYCKEK